MENLDIPDVDTDTDVKDDETVVEAAGNQVGKSKRINKGIPLVRLGDSVNPSSSQHKPQSKLLKSSETASSHQSTQSQIMRKKLQADLEAKKRIAQLEAEAELSRLVREKEIIEMQRKLEHAEIDEEAENSVEEKELSSQSDRQEVIRSWIEGVLPGERPPSVESRASSANESITRPNPLDLMAQTMVQAMTDAFKNASFSATPQIDMNSHLMRKSCVKDLPEFHGRPEEWPVFISSYNRSSEICKFSEEENMARLQKCLLGEALKAVQILLISPNNASKIVSTLEKLFGQPRHIVRHLIQKVRSISSVKDDKTIIEFSQAVTNMVQTMKMLNYEDQLSNPQLYDELLFKLPSHHKHEWATFIESGKRECLEEFVSWIDIVQSRTLRIYTPRSEPTETQPIKYSKPKKAVLLASESSAEFSKKTNKQCLYCNKDGHQIYNCRSFKSLELLDKGKFVREKKCCFRCLDLGHISTKCDSKRDCSVEGCKGRHHRLLHGMPYQKKGTSGQSSEVTYAPQVQEDDQVLSINSQISYAVLPIILKGPKGEVSTHAMLDTGSAFTLLDEAVAKTLGLNGIPKNLAFRTLGPESNLINSQVVSVSAVNPKTKISYQMDNVHTYPDLNLRSGTLKRSQLNRWKHLKDLDLPTYSNAKPKILIGLPHADLISTVKCPRNAPVASETKLGWVIMGDMRVPLEADRPDSVLHLENRDTASLHTQVKNFFSCEDFGVKLSETQRYSRNEQRAIDIASSTLKRGEKKYEIGLLWARDDIVLPESRTTALQRLKSLERKIDRSADYAQKYCANFQHYIDAGYVKKLSDEESMKLTQRTWYLPHFGVERENKPGKLRLVFDAAARSHGVSLNDHLLKGPDILKPLPAVLCKFRERKIAITGYIREMFHQVAIRHEDQESQRLLWRGMDRRNPPDEYKMVVMTFGATCSPYCAQFVKNANASEYSDEFPRAADAIINRHYVDDLLDSCDTDGEALKLFEDIMRVQQKGGFHVCNWATNSRKLLSKIPVDLRSKSQKSIGNSEDPLNSEKILGLTWQPTEDAFAFTLNFCKVSKDVLNGETTPTKREASSLIMSIFDPLGFVANLTVKAKILLQKTWRANIDWDDKLPESIFKVWKDWIFELQGLPSFRIPRCYSIHLTKAQDVQLHVFCDASELAYAAVAYFRIQNEENVEVKFVAAKTRVTPLKPLTVPRCELQAALMGARLAKSICEWHEIVPSKKIFWTDSRTVACWLRMDGGQLKTFVSHRISEIQELSSVENWHWLPTYENVADEATRDDKLCSWDKSSRWLNGPEFLKYSEEYWPQETENIQVSPETLEIKKEYIGAIQVSEPLMDLSRFSSYLKLLRSTTYVFRFISILKGIKPKSPFLTITELNQAQKYLLKSSQAQTFGKELRLIALGVPLKDSRLSSLSLFLDQEGVLCLKGRVQGEVTLGNLERNPPVLDPKSPFAKLLNRYHHEKAGHHVQDRVVNELKQRYCILKLRAAVRRSWHECQHCKNMRAIPKSPQMSALPHGRLASYQRPFTHTGVDYFGPLEVAIGRRREKRYGALFTCLTTRAIHLELAGALSTDSFIMALRRFICRRGAPIRMYSDNGTNFVGAHKELNDAIRELNQQRISEELSTKEIEWIFNPPSAPHMGGSWERMVRSVKVALDATLKERVPREETLNTVLIEAECTVNGHPLTYVSSDESSPEVLTPNHFLIGTPTSSQPPGIFTESDLVPGKQWRYAQRLSDHFWSRWIKEFLPTLTRRQKWNQPQKPLEVGDLVIVMDSAAPRNSWLRGVITEVPATKDGQTRWALVKTALGTYKRPAVKLCVLDVK